MRGVYTASFDCSGISAGPVTLMVLQAPSNGVLEILSTRMTNLNTNSSEQWAGGLYRITNIGAPVFSGVADIQKHEMLDPSTVASASGKVMSGEPTYNLNPIDRQGFNNFGGYFYDPLPEERPVVPPGAYVGLRLTTPAPTTSHINALIVYREIG